jgi:hypothetical protein
MVAAYAIESKRALSKLLLSFSDMFGTVFATTEHIARPIGNNIRVVDVFITHMLIKAETSMNPPISLGPSEPSLLIIINARRLWRPDLSIDRAIKKPPKKRYMFLFAYGSAAVSIEVTPRIGKRAKGNKEVTGIGMASVAHQVTINSATAATNQALLVKPVGEGNMIIVKKKENPYPKTSFSYCHNYIIE